ncbi:MAG TPA: carboxysome shell protein, partial [Thermopetrobacter sp.]|nr:carboxysome shell protein [Thermopetrobacter sp.]
ATDALRVHVPDKRGGIDVNRWLESAALFDATREMTAGEAQSHLLARVRAQADAGPWLSRLLARLIVNDFAQIAWVRELPGGHHPDIGHAERFICAGDGFAEVQWRNLAYLARVREVEEAGFDLDVGMKILTALHVKRGRAIPLVLRYDYDGPADRARAAELCARNAADIRARYAGLVTDGMLHILQVARDRNGGLPEVLADSTRDDAKGA